MLQGFFSPHAMSSSVLLFSSSVYHAKSSGKKGGEYGGGVSEGGRTKLKKYRRLGSATGEYDKRLKEPILRNF